jgi:hypothetical protein
MLSFIWFNLLYLLRLYLFKWNLWLLIIIKFNYLRIKNQIFSWWKTKEKWMRKSNISTYCRWNLWLSLNKIIIVVFFDDNGCLLEHRILAHFSGSYTDNWSKIFIFLLFEMNIFSKIGNFIIFSKSGIE